MKINLSVFLILFLMPFLIHAQDSLPGKDSNIEIPDGISIDGIPPISFAQTETVNPYLFSRFSYLQDWHPSKQEILIISDIGAVQQAYSVAIPGGMRKQLTFFNEPVYQSLFEPNKGNYIIVLKDKDGDEFYQVYQQDLSSGKTVLLSNGGRSYVSNLFWNKKGDKLFYTSLNPKSSTKQIFSVNPEIPASNHIFINLAGLNWNLAGISRDESEVLLTAPSQGSNTVNTLWLYNVNSGNTELLLPAKEKKGSYFPIDFTDDDSGMYLITNQENEFNQLAFYNFKNHNLQILTHFNWDIRRATLSPDKTKLAFTVNEAGNIKPYIFYTKSKKYVMIKGMPVGFISGMLWSRDSKTLGFQLSTSYANSDIYEWNSSNGKVLPWVQNETGGIDASTIPAPELIKWKSFDGLEISGFLYPAAKKFKDKRPVIIDIHGGPVQQSLPVFNNKVNYYTNELGISVIFPNIRGSDGFGKMFAELDNGTKKENAVKDIGSLLDWIDINPQLDATRVMVTGGSYGGYMTYRAAIEYNDRIRCAVEAFGISDMLSYKNTIDSVYKEFFTQEYGDDKDPAILEYFRKTSPLRNANNITKPIFIVQGKNDPRIPYTESEQMVKTIKNKGGTVWYLLANNEGHGFFKQENIDYLFYATVEFIKKFLLD
jgi:dipeptidyl aminopeptidase/acylaminoacyl peptidase